MTKYKLSNVAKEDLIRIHQYGIKRFGINQADKYFNSLFDHFQIIAERHFKMMDAKKSAVSTISLLQWQQCHCSS